MGELTAHIYKLSLNVFTMIQTPPTSSDLRSHLAYNAVVEVMKGSKGITKQYIERKILNAKGVCKLL